MIDDMIVFCGLMEKSVDVDLLCEMIGFVV